MTILRFNSSMSILLTFVIFQAGSVNHYVHHSCSTTDKFANNHAFEFFLGKLLTFLSSETRRRGYTYRTVPTNESDIIFGHALCHGDVSKLTCKRCVMKAGDDIRILCPHDKTAIIWYEKCFLKYSDTDFYGRVDGENKLVIITKEKVSEIKYFNERRSWMLNKLAVEASENKKRFAKGNAELDESTKLYGLTQCTLDISSTDCRRCLNDPIKQLPKRIGEKSGAYFISGSCIFRYETYPF